MNPICSSIERTAGLLLAAALSACVYVPRTTTDYDRECEITTHHMTLDVQQVATIGRCNKETCAAALVLFGAVTAASAVVSGSIVLAGNGVYWAEDKGKCFVAGKRKQEEL